MYCSEESTCDIVGTFRRPVVIRRPGNCAPPRYASEPMIFESECKTKNWYIVELYRFPLIMLKITWFFNRTSLLSADFSWKSVTRLLAESSSFFVTPFRRFRSQHLATLAVSTIHSDCHVMMRTGESTQSKASNTNALPTHSVI